MPRTSCARSARRARRNAEREAKKIVALAVQRIASEHTSEISVSSVSLPNDEMKGRIIGREGRNIRAFELATGVDVIIDDTPDTVVVSCFDPVRREVARVALSKLVADGRIHPGRIEEVVEKSKKEVDAAIQDMGEQAAYEVGAHGLNVELIRLIGRMQYRTSYGQNILHHSKEVAHLAGIMAAELGLDVAMAKRGALLHDIGKVLTHEHEGTHVQLGVEVATRYGEHPLDHQLHRRASRRCSARERDLGARAGRGCDLRIAARRASRSVRDVRQAAGGARAHRRELLGCRQGVRHSGGERDQGDRQSG